MKDIHATVLVNVKNKSEEELFRNAEYTRRKNVKKAIREGLYIEETDSEKEYKNCYNLYSNILNKGGSVPFSYLTWKKWADEEKWKFFVIKLNRKSVGYFSIIPITKKFYGVESNEKGIRARVFAYDKNYSDYRVNDFIYWNTILQGLKEGVDFVDLGGYQIKPRGHLREVNKFKERWGGEIFYFYPNFPMHVAVVRKLIRNFGFMWWLNEKMKRFKITSDRIFLKQKID